MVLKRRTESQKNEDATWENGRGKEKRGVRQQRGPASQKRGHRAGGVKKVGWERLSARKGRPAGEENVRTGREGWGSRIEEGGKAEKEMEYVEKKKAKESACSGIGLGGKGGWGHSRCGETGKRDNGT